MRYFCRFSSARIALYYGREREGKKVAQESQGGEGSWIAMWKEKEGAIKFGSNIIEIAVF
jgi:hypothetical protein